MSKAFAINVFVLLLCLAMGIPSFSKDFATLHYTIDDGLPSNNVYRIYRDSRGFLWFATDKGIARYNGIKFQTFTTFDGLPDNEIFFFQEDFQHRVWMATYNGELCYYKDGIFHTALNTKFLQLPFKAPQIIDILLQKDSSITIPFYSRRKFINIQGERIKVFDIEEVNNQLQSQRMVYVAKLSPNRYKILYNRGSVCIIDSNAKIITIKNERWKNSFNLYKSYEQEYTFDGDSVYSLNEKAISAFRNFTSDNTYNFFYDNGDLFACTDNGLYINDEHLLPGIKVSSVLKDIDSNYWIASLNDGVFVMNGDLSAVKEYKNAYEGSIKYASIVNNNLFYATANNNLYRSYNGKTTCIFNYQEKMGKLYLPAHDPAYLIDSFRYYNYYGNNSYIITDLFDSKPHIKSFTSFFANPPAFFFDDIKNIIATPDKIYLALPTKIAYAEKTDFINKGHIPLYNIVGNHNASEDRIFTVAKDSLNNIWFSTLKNIYKVTDGVSALQSQFGSLAFKRFGIYGQYIVGYTHKNKLIICNNINGKISVDSIVNHDCIWNGLYKLDNKHILIGTNKLYRLLTLYVSSGKPVYNIRTLENDFLPIHAEYIYPDNELCYFFKDGTITTVNNNTFLGEPHPPRLFFTSITTNKKTTIAAATNIIPYENSKNIDIQFSTLSFNSKNVFYEYSISKNDEDNWHSLASEEINLFSLGYGTYYIKIRAKSFSSNYSVPITLVLQIGKPFWATWWFLALSFLFFLSVLFIVVLLFVKRRLRKIKKENEMNIKILKSDYKALNALMNPHFIFNSLNNIQGLINENDKRAANEYLRVFSDMVRQNMHNISLELIPLQKEIDLIKNYLKLEKLRFSDWLNYSITIDPYVELDSIMIPPLLIQPLVENSIKHGLIPKQSHDNSVNIHVFEKSDKAYVEIIDNGIGITQAQRRKSLSHQSFGLLNIQRRIEYLRNIYSNAISFNIEEIINENGEVQGTKATICFIMPE